MKFKELLIGSHFSTKEAEYIKTHSTKAVVVDSSVLKVGDIVAIEPNKRVIKLYNDMEGR